MSAAPDLRRVGRALVYGLGLSGLAAAGLLRRKGAEVIGFDDRPLPPDRLGELAADPGFRLLDSGAPRALPARLPDGLEVVIASPGVPADRPLLAAARERGIPVVAEVELAWQHLDGRVVAVTGSNGKSTTTALTGALLAAAGPAVEICGNIGVPLSACVEGPPGRLFVVELSSFQLEGVASLAPAAAALLNVSPDHLDRHGDLDAYRAAKQRIFAFQGPGDVAVVHGDEPGLAPEGLAARLRHFSLAGPVGDGCWLDGERVVERAPGELPAELFRLADLPLVGRHNVENAMAAALLALAAGAPRASLPAAIRAFRGLPHRLQRVGERGGVAYFDDSKGTNVGATARSLEGFAPASVHLILGGRNKGADLGGLRPSVARAARAVYLIGEAAAELAPALAGACPLVPCGTLDVAVARAAAAARPGEAVVLSPACASFDQFRDFVHRGREFQRLVGALLAGEVAGG
ncbi:MAG: UDP-N-acetylmuramoyl-L-alanine--D-glutamate ligase [Thermoanaerobaculia bacterium]|nr:UDP-N-acetylmuramoyl-L-alanine--D-glutamate ligase [Thermoanaerobaculia bacterium]